MTRIEQLADEPTSALDAHNRALVLSLRRAEADRGAAVVVAVHDLEAAGRATASCTSTTASRPGYDR